MTDLLVRRLSVGKEVNAYCGRCKDERTHIVAAMDGQTIRRVTCSTCGSVHNFKSKPEPRVTKRAGGTRASKASSSPKAFQINSSKPVKSYSMQSLFSTGDVINHPKFGLGEVQTAPAPNKIEVRFQEGTKLLLHNMKSVD